MKIYIKYSVPHIFSSPTVRLESSDTEGVIVLNKKACKDSFDQQHENLTDEQLQELYPKLQRYCLFLSQNSWDGEDLVQESMLKAWLHYRHQPKMADALVKRIARNKWIDTIRKRSKESLEALPEHTINDTQQIDHRFEAVEKLLKQLTPKQAVMLVLKEGFQFQLAEIAELMNTTETAVKGTIYRAKQRMAKQGDSETNPLIEQYWEGKDQQKIEKILHESFKTQDPTILIKSIPLFPSLSKNPICSLHKSQFNPSLSSGTVTMAA